MRLLAKRLFRLSSVRTRLTLWSVAVLALALTVFAGALRSIVQVNLDTAINRSLVQEARGHQQMTARRLESRPDDFGPGPGGPGTRLAWACGRGRAWAGLP